MVSSKTLKYEEVCRQEYRNLAEAPREHPRVPGKSLQSKNDFIRRERRSIFSCRHFVLPMRPKRCLPKRLAEPSHPQPRVINMDNRSEEHTSELQSRSDLVCRLLLEKKKASDRSSDNS